MDGVALECSDAVVLPSLTRLRIYACDLSNMVKHWAVSLFPSLQVLVLLYASEPRLIAHATAPTLRAIIAPPTAVSALLSSPLIADHVLFNLGLTTDLEHVFDTWDPARLPVHLRCSARQHAPVLTARIQSGATVVSQLKTVYVRWEPLELETSKRSVDQLALAGRAKGVAVLREPRATPGRFGFDYFFATHSKPLPAQ